MTAALDAARSALRGEPAWVVGGAIRDRLLGRDVVDVDIVVSGDVARAAKTLAVASGGPRFALSDAFGAWRVMAPDSSWQVDLMALQGADIEDDLSRRDFTINAIAEPLDGGMLLDPFDGVGDIGRHRLRAVSAAAFDADPLRTLRLVRFACELGLEADVETTEAAKARVARIGDVATERVFAELRRVIGAPAVIDGLTLMDGLGLTAVLLPEIDAMHGVEQNRYHHLDVYDHTIEVVEQVRRLEADPVAIVGDALGPPVAEFLRRPFVDSMTRGMALRLGALLHDVAKPLTQQHHADGSVLGFPGHSEQGAEMARAILARLNTSERLRAHQAALSRHHLRAGYLVAEAPLDRRTIYSYLTATGDVAVDVTLLSIADRLATSGDKASEAIPRHIDVALELLGAALAADATGPPEPLVRGDDLARALGIPTGPEIGRLLAEIAAAQFAQEIGSREEAIDYARQLREG